MKFSMRKFTSLSLGFSFLIMTYTGVMLYFVPKGKVAYWADWHFLGLSKSQYGDIHTTSMVTFLLFGFLHIYYNWKPLVSYMKNSAKEISLLKGEFLAAFVLNLFFIIGTLFMLQPFKGYLDLEEGIKSYWAQECGEPPYGHAEESTLAVFCKKMGLDSKKSLDLLKQKGIVATGDMSLKDIAKKNGIAPQDIYTIIAQNGNLNSSTQTDSSKTPSMLGRKTLQELSEAGYIDLQDTMKILHEHGLKSIDKESHVKNIADELDMMPIDLYKLIKKR